MIQIDWEEYKEFKNNFTTAKELDNFAILLYFLKGYYNVKNIDTMFEILIADELSKMMLDKRGLYCADELEHYLLEIMRS
jgi:hypothetical protein